MLKKFFSAVLFGALVLGICPCVALADSPDSASESMTEIVVAGTADGEAAYAGTIGTCTWAIDAAGCLTIAPQDGISGEFSSDRYMYVNSWPWYSNRAEILSARVESGVSIRGSLRHFFSDCSSLASLDLSGIDTSNVTDMGYMFYNCTSLTALDLSNLDTSQVTNMNYMFYGCSALATVDLTGFDTSNVTGMSCMFENCTSLVSLDLAGFDTAHVTSMSSMFESCSALTTLDLSNFNTSSVTNMGCLFDGCTSLASIDFSGFDTSNVAYMCYMFDNCVSLSALDLSGWDTSHLTNTYRMFYRCSSLGYLDLSSFDTSQVENSSSMFFGCWGLRTVIFGEKFSFEEVGYLPVPIRNGISGKWMADNGTVYNRPSLLPNNVATTYTAVFPHLMTTYAGTDRYETTRIILDAVANSGAYDGVIVCSGEDGKFADALCASGLSGALDYPIVLVDGSAAALEEDSAALIWELIHGVGDVIVLGGEDTVSASVASALCAYDADGSVVRIAGADRYATAEEVYIYGESHGGWSTDYAVLAKGNDFPDALGAASFCTTYAVPMLLTDQNSTTLSDSVLNAADCASEVVIAGGTTSVSAEKGDELKNYAAVERFGGSTRYETNLVFARWELNHGMTYDNAGIATGANFPDALGSGYLLSQTDSVLLLTSKAETENAALYNLLADNAQTITNINVFGGNNSVTAATRSAIQSAIGGEWRIING